MGTVSTLTSGRQDGGGLRLVYHVEEVVALEYPLLHDQESEAQPVPHQPDELPGNCAGFRIVGQHRPRTGGHRAKFPNATYTKQLDWPAGIQRYLLDVDASHQLQRRLYQNDDHVVVEQPVPPAN